MKIALAHDFLIQRGGAEQVLKSFNELYKDAPIYTLFSDKDKFNFPKHLIKDSFLQNYPFIKTKYRWYLSFFAEATESLDFSSYDIVLSSASAFIKGIVTKPSTMHISYLHTPTRYLWSDTHSYVNNLKLGKIFKFLLRRKLSSLRLWDSLASQRVDYFIANSKTTQKRIKKYYKRDSTVIYPPVEIDNFYISEKIDDFYLAGGRLVPYKRIDLIVKAFNKLGLKLYVYGVGPEYNNLRKMAKSNIKFIPKFSIRELAELYSKAIAYIQPQVEDFGIMAVESMASGRPVIAYRVGGSLESIKENLSGVFFDRQDPASLMKAILHFKVEKFNSNEIRKWAMQFSSDNFKKHISEFINTKYQEYKNEY